MPYRHWRIPIPATNQLRIDTVVAMMYQMGWELHDPGVKGTAILTATSKPTNGQALTIESKNYSFRPSLGTTEGEVLIGATTADCMANLSNALNHTGTPGVDYTCAVADPYLSATYDATHVYLEARRVGDVGRGVSLAMNAFGSLSSASLLGGTPIVLKSNGEKGNRPYGYVAFDPEYSSDNYFHIRACLYWDLATHAGSCFTYNGLSDAYFSPSDFFTVCGSKDLVLLHALLYGISGGSTRKIFGHFPARDDTVTRTTASIASGRRVSVAVQSSMGFASGMVVTIVGLSEGRDKLIISSVPDSTHIVIENLPRNYAEGAYIGTPAMIFGLNSSPNYTYDFFEVAHPDHVGLAEGDAVAKSHLSAFGLSEIGHGDPDEFTWRYKIFPIHNGSDSSVPSLRALQNDGNFGAIEGALVGDILFINKDRSEPEAGTISFTTPTTLTDSTKNWAVNSLVGKNICIVNGPFSTVVRKIISNTATVLTVDCDWKLTQLPLPSDYPAPGWSYRIADWTWRVLDVQHITYYGHFCYREIEFTFTL